MKSGLLGLNGSVGLSWAIPLTLLLLLLACGPGQEPAPTPTATKAAVVATPTATATAIPTPTVVQPRKGGTLRVQVHLDPTGVDLHTPRGASSREFWIAQPALNYLVTEKPGQPGVIIPDLAKSWDVKFGAGGTADWTFTLDERAKWQNGQPVTAEDVKFNFDRVKKPPTGLSIGRAAPVGTYFNSVDDVRIDGNKIIVSTNTASLGFLSSVALTNFPIFNKAATQALPQPLIRNYTELLGSGPFVPGRFETGSRYTLTRNPAYWEEGLPYLDGIEVLVMVDGAVREAAIRTQQVDVVYPQLDAGVYTRIKDLPHLKAYYSLGDVGWWAVQMNEQRAPWNDFRVRRAVSLAMDRKLVGTVSERGYGAAYGILYPPGSPWALPEAEVKKLPGFAEDKKPEFAEAKRLLAEYSAATAYDFTKPIAMLTENRTENIEGATLLIQQLANVGITGVMDVQADAVTEAREIAHDFNIMIRRFGGSVEPDAHLLVQYTKGGARNFAAISYPEFDQMYKDQRAAKSKEERIAVIQKMARFSWEKQFGAVPLWFRATFHAFDVKVQNYTPTLGFQPDTANVTRVWLSQ